MKDQEATKIVFVRSDQGSVTHVRVGGVEIPASYANPQPHDGVMSVVLILDDVEIEYEGGPAHL